MNYALLADNKFQVERRLNKLKQEITKKYDTEVIDYNGNDKDFSVEMLLNELNTFPFLSEHRLIIINNPTFLSAKGSLDDKTVKMMEDYLKKPAEFSTLIIYVDQFKIDNRKKISKVIKKHMEVFEPEVLDDRTISRMINDDLTKRGIKISREAKEELDRRIISEFDNWPNELAKIELYGKNELRFEDIEVLISNASMDNVFDMVSGVLNKDLKQTLTVYQALPQTDKEPIALIMLLANQFRLIHQIQTLMNANVPFNDIAKTLKVHPYRVQVARPIASRYSTLDTLKVLNNLAELEQGIKNGNINPEIGFELFLIGATIS